MKSINTDGGEGSCRIMPDFKPNTLYYGDNLAVLRSFPAECVDLIYLDRARPRPSGH